MTDKIENLNDSNIDSVLSKSKTPILLYFCASWCMPCKSVNLILNELAEKYDTIKFYKIDIDASPKSALKYKIQSIPSFRMIKGGNVIEERSGLISKSDMLHLLNSYN